MILTNDQIQGILARQDAGHDKADLFDFMMQDIPHLCESHSRLLRTVELMREALEGLVKAVNNLPHEEWLLPLEQAREVLDAVKKETPCDSK